MATITEDYVSFETAKLLVRKGFDFNAEYESYYTLGGVVIYFKDRPQDVNIAPRITLQMAMKWLREVHNAFISIAYENDGVFVANLKAPLKGVDCMVDNKHNCWLTYEQACEAAIKYCLENLI